MSSNESDEEKTVVRKPKSGVRGFARRRQKPDSVAEKPVKSGFYSGCVTKCFNQIKAHSLIEEMKHALEDEDDVEDDLLLKCTRKKELTPLPSADPLLVISDDENDDVENCPEFGNSPEMNVNANALKSPSPPPPPPPPQHQRIRKTRATKQKKSLLNAVDNYNKSLSQAQQELLKSQVQQNKEPDMCIVDESDEVTVRVDHRGNLLRYTVSQEEPFSNIIMQIAEKEDVLEKHVMLVYKDKTLRPHDTPMSVGLKMADIIECHILSNLEDSLNDSFDPEDPNVIELVIQCKGSRHKENIKTYLNKPLSSVIIEYAKRVKKDPSCIQFIFDGEELTPSQTPKVLDLESGDMLDVKEVNSCEMDDIVNSKKARMSGRASPGIIHID